MIEKISAEVVEVETDSGKSHNRRLGIPRRLTISRLLDSIELTAGKNFALLIAEGYQDAIQSGDRRLRIEYERMLLAKVVADKVDINVNESEDTIQAKQAAFAEAIARLSVIAQTPTPTLDQNSLGVNKLQ